MRKNHTTLIIGLILLSVLQVLDTLTTIRAIDVGGNTVEANPIVGFFVDRGWLWQMKLIVAGTVTATFWFLRNKVRSARFVWIGVVIYMIVVSSNLWQIYSVTV